MEKLLNEFKGLIKENEQRILIPLFISSVIILIDENDKKIKINAQKQLFDKRKEIQILNKIITEKNGIGSYYLYIEKKDFCILSELENGNFARLSECRKLNLFNLIKLIKNGK